MKLVLARAAGIADPLELIDRQRAAYLQALRELDDVAAQATTTTSPRCSSRARPCTSRPTSSGSTSANNESGS